MIRWLALLLLLPAAAVAQPAPSVEGRTDAPVQVVTYLSFTCSHCAEREAQVSEPLHQLIQAGTVREETRHAVRDGLDLVAATLARCQGPAAYPGNRDALFATQAEWMAATQRWLAANGTALNGLSEDDARMAIARESGLLAVLAPRGLTEAAAAGCLADPAERAALTAQAQEAWAERGIPGTPFTLVNDQPVFGLDWPTLSAAIEEAKRAAGITTAAAPAPVSTIHARSIRADHKDPT